MLGTKCTCFSTSSWKMNRHRLFKHNWNLANFIITAKDGISFEIKIISSVKTVLLVHWIIIFTPFFSLIISFFPWLKQNLLAQHVNVAVKWKEPMNIGQSSLLCKLSWHIERFKAMT